ncbi:TlpA family protein disulfide reductase [Singulisphaera acidiphila]|uniref:TlpA family protein disulfide reductase n=1 Tax=Singulisphaera acidiphila TaxID=466153 RepID=UPI0002F6712C|nr:hypothetical protein [Singulisphaera acidiphila]
MAAAQGGTQGHLGPWSEAVAAQAFRVDAIPAILLIGPDGRVLATQLRREQIRSAVATALARE